VFRTLLVKPPAGTNIPETILKNMRWFLYDGLFSASALAIINVFYTLYLESLGASSSQIGMMSSLSNLIMLVVMLPGAWLSERAGSRKKAVLFSLGLSRFFILVSALLPFWFTGQAAVLPVIAVRLLIDNFNVVSVPPWTSLSADIVPMQHRGRYFATRNLVMSVSTMFTTLAVGRLISSAGRPQGFQAAMALAFAIGMFSTWMYSRIHEPAAKAAKVTSYSPRALIATLRNDGNLRNYAIYIFMWNASIALAGPFIQIFYVREVHATTAIVGTMTMIATLSGLFSTHLSGKLVEKWGGYKIQLISGLTVPLLPVIWGLVQSPWGALPAYLYDGFVWSANTLASFNFMLTLAKPSKLTLYNSIVQVGTSMGAILGASVGGLLVDAIGFRTVFFISGAARLLSMLVFWRMVRPAPLSASQEDEPEPLTLPHDELGNPV
jgi:MFS family permease